MAGTKDAATGYTVDFKEVSTVGLESSPHAEALAGLRANEARYFKNKYDHDLTVRPASEAADVVDWVHGILEDERGIVISSPPLQATLVELPGLKWAHVFYESGLAVNVLYETEDGGKRAVGFKLSEGMDAPEGAWLVQVGPPEVEAGRHHPRLLLRHQGRPLTT
jgi:hypothetical protein